MSRGANEELQGGRELNYVAQRDAYTGTLFSRVIEAINTLAKNSAVAAVGKVPPPPPVDNINVKGNLVNGVLTAPSEILHWTLEHAQAVNKGIQYISEIATDPNFTAPHILDHGCSRSAFLHLPAKDDNGNVQSYFLRSYAQYHGSDPAKPTVHGNLGGAIAIQMTGSSQTSLLPSKGSGTASPNGQQGGHGLGIVLERPAPGPRRNVL